VNSRHLKLLQQGKTEWNRWRRLNPQVVPDFSQPRRTSEQAIAVLSQAVVNEIMPGKVPPEGLGLERDLMTGPALRGLDLTGYNLRHARFRRASMERTTLVLADMRGADLTDANLTGAILTSANLTRANLFKADLKSATLRFTNCVEANLRRANLRLANLDGVNMTRANLEGANLGYASLVNAVLRKANLSSCYVFGTSTWNVDLTGACQDNLIITRATEPRITVDDLEIAQFLYMLLNNERVRGAIQAISTKVVLILGRFDERRRAAFDAMRTQLRKRNYLPVIFDFERPASRDWTETISTLAHLSRFIIAEISEPRSVPKELEAIVPRLAVPVVPLIRGKEVPYSMFQDYWKYHWVLQPRRYASVNALLGMLERQVIRPAEAKARELDRSRAVALEGNRLPGGKSPRSRRG
jgi:uncharacterized protein YjbI with pentapeptide repeats